MKIYVGLSRPKSNFKFFSLLIRWSEIPKSIEEPSSWFSVYKASHVFLAYPAHPQRGFFMVNEAVGTGVRWTAEGHFIDHTSIQALYCFDLPLPVYRAVKNYGDMMSGAPYALKENIGIALQRIVKWTSGKDIANPFDSDSLSIKCSELFFRALFNHLEGVNLKDIKVDLWNTLGEDITADEDSLGVRDSELVLDWLARRGHCEKVSAIAPIQNSSGDTSVFSGVA